MQHFRVKLVHAVFCFHAFATTEAGATCDTAPESAEAVVPGRHAIASVDDWPQVILECVPRLDFPLGDRWPLTLWESGEPERWDSTSLRAASARGIVPAIRLDTRWLPLARLLQHEGLPVIVIEGRGGKSGWPYSLAGDSQGWTLEYGDTEVPSAWRNMPVPTRFEGWATAAAQLRKRLVLFKSAGVTIDGFWLDYETQPSQLDFAAIAYATNRTGLPEGVVTDEQAFTRYRRQLWHALLSAYVAAPIREVYPEAAVTNWLTLVSTPEAPTHSWRGLPHPASGPTLFTHSNPAAYGIDTGFRAQVSDAPDDDRWMPDWLYLHILLRQASEDAANRSRAAPYLGSVAWVARWVPDREVTSTPVMSREMYREGLRHLWLRDVDAMAVFNPVRAGYAPYQLAEVQDAAQVLDEMLAFADLLDNGTVLDLTVPSRRDVQPFWSGIRAGDRALVRVFNPLESEHPVSVEVWTGIRIDLSAPPGGTTFVLRRGPQGNVEVEPAPAR